MYRRLFLFVIMLCGAVVLLTPTQAQRSVFWAEWNVVIDNMDTTANRFDVSEQYLIDFSGTFEFGTAAIPLDRVENISNVRVFEGGTVLEQVECGFDNRPRRTGAFCTQRSADELVITYNFFRPITNDSQQFEISYTVDGALRIYEGGDQLWWQAVTEDKFGFSVGSSTVTVELPPDTIINEDDLIVAVQNVDALITRSGQTITAQSSGTIGPNDFLEIRVQYPHNPNAVEASWQADYDEQVAFEENIKPLLEVGLLALSLVIAIVGPLFMYTRWYNHGRDPDPGPVPAYLSEPPSDLPPAVVGTLIDEQAQTRDVLSTLIDVARRGYVVFEESRTEGLFGLGGSSSFTFKRTDKSVDDLRPFEQAIMRKIFVGKLERDLDSLKNSFYKSLPGLQDGLYDELLKEGLFTDKPSSTRSRYTGIGTAIVLVAGAIGFFGFEPALSVTGALLCVPVAFAFVGIMVVLFGNVMPAKTQKGSLESAKWKAFRKYLQNLEKYNDVESVPEQFDRYLPYAVAFGMERTWIRRFTKSATVPMPTWYFPTYRGGRYSGGYRPGTPISRGGGLGDMMPGNIAQAGGGGLDSMSDTLSGGLTSISDGLTEMLNTASQTITSKPSSSGSSGGWSGGGSFGGGGSSGGGSRGFG